MTRTDPLVGFHFTIEVSGKMTGFFTEVSGIGSENEVVEQKVVTEDGHQIVKKIPGRMKWGDITLKRGITDAMDAYTWRKMVEDGDVAGARCNGTITMFDQMLQPVAQWDFTNACVPYPAPGLTFAGDMWGFTMHKVEDLYAKYKRPFWIP